MPNKNYLRGRRFEYDLKKQYENTGSVVYRCAGSHGKYDLISLNYSTKVITLLQCKTKLTTKSVQAGPYGLYQEMENSNGWIVQGHKVTKYIRRTK